MYLTHLSLLKFRNFARLDIEVPCGNVVMVGGNAQGKTSILEAIYYLATFNSFHAANDRQLINFHARKEPQLFTKIIADFHYRNKTEVGSTQIKGIHRLEIRLIQEENGLSNPLKLRREFLLDGVKSKLADATGFFNAVLFLPQMLQIIEGSPEERRRYLNLAMSQVIPKFSSNLAEYNQILSQRNALLKQLSEKGGNPDQLLYWDNQLSGYGSRIIFDRIHTILELDLIASRIHEELTRGSEKLKLYYQPAYDPYPRNPRQYSLLVDFPLDFPIDRSKITIEEITKGFKASLECLRHEEINRGITTIGPHRDDLKFFSNNIDLGLYGSRGQNRTAMLALKLAEVVWMKEKTGQWPVLLLDEVLAELDLERREDLLNHLRNSEQALLTTTDLELFSPDFVKNSRIWIIRSGRIAEKDSL